MNYNLSNGIIEVEISSLGAELLSLRRVSAPFDYLWHGDAAFWDRRSPVLFPICGTLWNNEARFMGQTYSMTQHGFLRDMEFQLIADEDRHMAFVARADEQSKTRFPYDFEVQIDYTLLRGTLTVRWTVRNRGLMPMPFQIGAHPGFCYPKFKEADEVHGYLSFDVSSMLVSTTLSGPFVTNGSFQVPLQPDGLLPLTNHTFDCDTIIDASGQVHRITLHDKDCRPVVTLKHSMPVTALWSPRGGAAPFVCIEPWFGSPDTINFDDDFSRKPFVETLQSGRDWSTEYQIIIE